MSQALVATTPRQMPSEMDDMNKRPRRMATSTCSGPSKPKHCEAPLPRLTMPEMIAASCSAAGRSRLDDIAMSRPSDDTATASDTPAVDSTKPLSSQLKLRASWLSPLRSEEHTSELQSLMRISYAVFCLKKKKPQRKPSIHQHS